MHLILADETVIDLMPESVPDKHLVVSCANKTAFQKIWSKLTPANLEEVTVTEDGETVQTVTGMSVTGTQTNNLPDGIMIGHFYMTGGVSQYFVTLDEGEEFPEGFEAPEETWDPVTYQEDVGEPESSPDESEGEVNE